MRCRLKDSGNCFIKQFRSGDMIFSQSTPEELAAEMNIGQRSFGGEYITPLQERIAFQRQNPYTSWSLKAQAK